MIMTDPIADMLTRITDLTMKKLSAVYVVFLNLVFVFMLRLKTYLAY